MKVYAVEECVDYEGCVVRGLYFSEERAEDRKKELEEDNLSITTYYEVSAYEVEE